MLTCHWPRLFWLASLAAHRFVFMALHLICFLFHLNCSDFIYKYYTFGIFLSCRAAHNLFQYTCRLRSFIGQCRSHLRYFIWWFPLYSAPVCPYPLWSVACGSSVPQGFFLASLPWDDEGWIYGVGPFRWAADELSSLPPSSVAHFKGFLFQLIVIAIIDSPSIFPDLLGLQ